MEHRVDASREQAEQDEEDHAREEHNREAVAMRRPEERRDAHDGEDDGGDRDEHRDHLHVVAEVVARHLGDADDSSEK